MDDGTCVHSGCIWHVLPCITLGVVRHHSVLPKQNSRQDGRVVQCGCSHNKALGLSPFPEFCTEGL